ncbi:unnamed protein product, partial [Iphiclides podalirius]
MSRLPSDLGARTSRVGHRYYTLYTLLSPSMYVTNSLSEITLEHTQESGCVFDDPIGVVGSTPSSCARGTVPIIVKLRSNYISCIIETPQAYKKLQGVILSSILFAYRDRLRKAIYLNRLKTVL